MIESIDTDVVNKEGPNEQTGNQRQRLGSCHEWSWKDALQNDSNEAEKIQQLQNLCIEKNIDASKVCSIGEPEELCLLRYLRANSLDPVKALEQLEGTLRWREETDIWSLMAKTPASILECDPEKIAPYYPHWQRGFDKHGRPILIKQYGGFETWHLKELTTLSHLASWHAWEQEQNASLLAKQSAALGKPITQYCIIVDVGGMVLKQVNRDFVSLVKRIAKIDQNHHPERMGKTFIINTPKVFPMVWKGITPFLDKNTVAKIEIYAKPKDWKAALLGLIDEDQLPLEYGGTGPPLHPNYTPTPEKETIYEGDEVPWSETKTDIFEVSTLAPSPIPDLDGYMMPAPHKPSGSFISSAEMMSYSSYMSDTEGMSSANGTLGSISSQRIAAERGRRSAESTLGSGVSELCDIKDLPVKVRKTLPSSELKEVSRKFFEESSDDEGDEEVGRTHWGTGSHKHVNARRMSGSSQGQPQRKWSRSSSMVLVRTVCWCLPTYSQVEKLQGRLFLLICYKPIQSMMAMQQSALTKWHDRVTGVFLLIATLAVCLGSFTLHRSQWNSALAGVFWVSFILVCCGTLSFVLGFIGTVGNRYKNKHLLMSGLMFLESIGLLQLILCVLCFVRGAGIGTQSNSTESTMYYFYCAIGYLLMFLISWAVIVTSFVLAKQLHKGQLDWSMDNNSVIEQIRSTLRMCSLLSVVVATINIAFSAKGIYESSKYDLGGDGDGSNSGVNFALHYVQILFAFSIYLVSALGYWVSRSLNKIPFILHWALSVTLVCFLFSNAVYNLNQASNIKQVIEDRYSSDLDNSTSDTTITPKALETGLFANFVIVGMLKLLAALFVSAETVVVVVLYRNITVQQYWTLREKHKLSKTEKALVAWGVLSGLIFIFLNGTFAIIHQYIAHGAKNWMTRYWEFVGRFDSRYTSGDSFMVTVNGILALVVGPGCLLYAWSVYDHHPYRHIIGSLICIIQIYTQVLCFSVEIMEDFTYTSVKREGAIFCLMITVGIFKLVLPVLVTLYSLRKLTEDSRASSKYKKLIKDTSWQNLDYPALEKKEEELIDRDELPLVFRKRGNTPKS